MQSIPQQPINVNNNQRSQPIYRRPAQPIFPTVQPKQQSKPKPKDTNPFEFRFYHKLLGKQITLHFMGEGILPCTLVAFSQYTLFVRTTDGKARVYFKHAVEGIEFDPEVLAEMERFAAQKMANGAEVRR